MKKKLFLTSAAAALTLSSNLYAGEKGAEIEIAPATDGWEFAITPYAWLSGIKGTVGLPGLPPSDIDAAFSEEIWDNLDFAGFLTLEANKGKFRSFFDIQYVKLGADTNGPGGKIELGVEQVRLELGLGYEIYSTERSSVVAYGAVMYNYVDNSLSSTVTGSVNSSDSWVDPAIGLKYHHQINDRWFTNFAGEYGGFGVSSESTWQLLGLLGYDFGNNWSAIGGYRHQSIDYSKGGFIYGTETSGPFLGASYRF